MKITIENEDDNMVMDVEATLTSGDDLEQLVDLLQTLRHKVFPWKPKRAPTPPPERPNAALVPDEVSVDQLEAPLYPRPGVEEPF